MGDTTLGLRRTADLVAVGLVGAAVVGIALGVPRPGPVGWVLLSAPLAISLVLLRPAWLLLGVLLLPPGVVGLARPRMLMLAAGLGLVGLLLRHGRIWLGPRTGAYPVLGLVVLAALHPAAVGAGPAEVAAGASKILLYYGALAAFAYNAVRLGELDLRRVGSALLAGAVLLIGLQTVFGGEQGLLLGRNSAYLAAMGLGVAAVRLATEPRWRWVYGAAAVWLGGAIVAGPVRAALLAAVVTVVVTVVRLGRGRWLLAGVPLLLLPLAAVPVVQRIIPWAGGASDVTLVEYTTGRWALWQLVWREVVTAPWWGHGWGWWWSRTPEDLFGFRNFVSAEASGDYLYAHNDVLFLLVELGVLGAIVWLAYWWQLGTAVRRAWRWRQAEVLALVGVVVVFLVVQLVDNGFAIRAVGERALLVGGTVLAAVHARAETVR